MAACTRKILPHGSGRVYAARPAFRLRYLVGLARVGSAYGYNREDRHGFARRIRRSLQAAGSGSLIEPPEGRTILQPGQALGLDS